MPGTLAPLNHYRSNLRLWKHRASLAVEPVPEAVKEARRSRIMSDERPGTHWDQGFSLGLSWINYNDLTVLPNPGIMVSIGNHPQMALFQISEIL